jgi:hypothetical protein
MTSLVLLCVCASLLTLSPVAAAQVLLLSLLFTGYLVNIAAVTPVLQWVHYLSVFFFGFESLIVNEMSGISLIFAVRAAGCPLHLLVLLPVVHKHIYVLFRHTLPWSNYILCVEEERLGHG